MESAVPNGFSHIIDKAKIVVAAGMSPIDNWTYVLFRIVFGYFVAQWAWDYLENGIVERNYVQARFHFTYYGLDWIKPLPGYGMYYLFVGFVLLGVAIALGCMYRVATFLWALGFTYFFLLERTNYQNHYYLMVLISWCLPFLSLHRRFSIDVWLNPNKLRTQSLRWELWLLRFHLAIPYFYGGIAKINSDWLQGQPLGEMLLSKKDLPMLGWFFQWDAAGLVLAWGGLLFDLLIVPMLMWKRTRWLACLLCLAFHLMNSIIFHIHIFPWLMLASTPIFFEPDWLPKLFGTSLRETTMAPLIHPTSDANNVKIISSRQRWIAAGLAIYVLFHLVWPLRHFYYEGNPSWTERGHYFAWRMMLRGKKAVLGFAIKDRVTGKVVDGRVNDFLTKDQSEKFGRDPEMILHFAHFLGKEYERTTGNPSSVYALALVSLNGRKPELMIDPNRDLTKIKRESVDRTWVLPQTEPLRFPAWDVPATQWRQHVQLPKLHFLNQDS